MTRYATVLLELDNERVSSGEEITSGELSVTRERLRHFNLVDNETVVMLCDLRGNLDRARTVYDAAPEVLNYEVITRGDGDGFAYLHCRLQDPVKSLVSTLHEHEVVLDMPLEFLDDGTVRATLIGKSPALGPALEALSEIVEVALERTGKYRPETRDLGANLTDRQHQILTIAVEHGYYEVPRRATLVDVAAEVDLSRATVGEHLQKIEATILSQVVR